MSNGTETNLDRMRGNFAAGQCLFPFSPPSNYGDFARGQRELAVPIAEPDYAAGLRSLRMSKDPVDFARGQHVD
jgi:hypothetical protein